MRAVKIRAFSVFKANFHALKPPKCLWKWFSNKNMKLVEQLLVKSFYVLMIFDKLYLVKIGPIFDDSQLSCVTFHYKILSVCSFGCKNLLNSTRQPANFHNRHHTNKYIQLTEYEVGRFALYEVKSCCSFYIRWAIKVIDMWPERTRNLP